jgi:large subunit ribosomal protein L10
VNLDGKKQIVDDLEEKFSNAKIVILTNFSGMDVAAMNSLRRKLREAKVEYKVVKNTLLARAAENNSVSLIKDSMKNASAVAYSFDDPVTPAKVLCDFAKDNEKFQIKAGVLQGKALSASAIEALSSLPSREVLLSQLLSVMTGVPTGFVRALNNIPQKMLFVLTALKDKKEQAAANG